MNALTIRHDELLSLIPERDCDMRVAITKGNLAIYKFWFTEMIVAECALDYTDRIIEVGLLGICRFNWVWINPTNYRTFPISTTPKMHDWYNRWRINEAILGD